jgi:ABC-type polar amino acid transport system ATPase subunit
MMASVQLVNVSKRFGKVQAMHHIDLDVKSGEVLSLLGPSGCGKTTTLRSIVGLEEPNEGEIYIEHRNVRGIPIHKRAVGMVFEDYALFVYWQNQAASHTSGPLCVGDTIHLAWKPEHTLMLENDDERSDFVTATERA